MRGTGYVGSLRYIRKRWNRTQEFPGFASRWHCVRADSSWDSLKDAWTGVWIHTLLVTKPCTSGSWNMSDGSIVREIQRTHVALKLRNFVRIILNELFNETIYVYCKNKKNIEQYGKYLMKIKRVDYVMHSWSFEV